MEKDALISVVVITYNSAAFVRETLDSIHAQSYRNLELIISDDCSKDNTVDVCSEWVEQHKDRFVDCKIISVEQNTGVSANINRGFRAAKGVYIKDIAGDDLLLSDCIEKNVEYVRNNSFRGLVFSRMKVLAQDGVDPKKCPNVNQKQKKAFALSPKHFRIRLLFGCFLAAPSAFISKEVYDQLGGFNEQIPLVEDYPFWLKALEADIPFGYIDEETVAYRVHGSNLSIKKSKRFLESERLSFSLGANLLKKYNKWLWFEQQLRVYMLKYPKFRLLFNFLRLLNPGHYYYYHIKNKCK